MKVVNVEQQKKWHEFALSAGEHFIEHPDDYSYTVDGEVEPEQLFAVRWNDYSVLVFQINDLEPCVYPIEGLSLGRFNPDFQVATVRENEQARERLHEALGYDMKGKVEPLPHLVERVAECIQLFNKKKTTDHQALVKCERNSELATERLSEALGRSSWNQQDTLLELTADAARKLGDGRKAEEDLAKVKDILGVPLGVPGSDFVGSLQRAVRTGRIVINPF